MKRLKAKHAHRFTHTCVHMHTCVHTHTDTHTCTQTFNATCITNVCCQSTNVPGFIFSPDKMLATQVWVHTALHNELAIFTCYQR